MSELSPIAKGVAWVTHRRPLPRRNRKQLGAQLGLLLLGLAGAFIAGHLAERHMQDDLLESALSISALTDPLTIARLTGTPADAASTSYKSLYTTLLTARKTDTDLRDVYLFGLHDDQMVFLVDTDTTERPLPPGTPYDDGSPALLASFHNGEPFIEGPMRDEWGLWVSGLVPIVDSTSKKIVAVLGVDIDAHSWIRTLWVSRLASPLLAGMLMWVLLALTAGRQQRQALSARFSASEERYRNVVENVREVIFQTDTDGLWTYLNPAWTEITEFALEESLDTNFLQYVPPEDRERDLQLFEPLIQRQTDHCRHVIRCLTKSGGVRWIEVHARLTFGGQGETSGATGTLRDVTERHEAEEALLERDRRLHASETLQRMLLDSIAAGMAIIDSHTHTQSCCSTI